MSHRSSTKLGFLAHLLALLVLSVPLRAQTAGVRGVVTDQSGAIVPKASVTLKGPGGLEKAAVTADNGSYAFTGLGAGNYTVEAAAPDLTLPQPQKFSLRGGVETVNLQLQVASQSEQVTVQDNGGPALSTDAESSAGAVTLRGDDLQALADDPDDLAADLQALAGPAAGPNSGQLFVDGFTGGQLPPKSSIREIRINSNPFSAEYDTLGYGRIEIFTKPGTDKFHGTGFYNFGDDFWNSRNPYAAEKAPFLLKEYGGNIGGPLSRRASFTLEVERHAIDNGAIINGSTLDLGTLAIINPYTQVFRVPQRRVIVTPRADYQLNAQNSLTVRYTFTRADIADGGIGSFNLVSEGYDIQIRSQMLQATETMVIGASAVNETRFQYFRVANTFTPNTAGADAAIQVLGSFNQGPAPIGHSADTQNSYELHNYTSIAHGHHAWRFGARLRGATDRNVSRRNFAGTFTFGGGLAPVLDPNNQPLTSGDGQPLEQDISSIESYQRTLRFQAMTPEQIRALGGGASQFTIASGAPSVFAGQFELGAFASDDWRVKPNLTLSLGLRYETQTNIHDWRDFAPRLGVAWAPGGGTNSRPKTVIRAGFGIFYDRFALANKITASLYDGHVQQQYIFANPDFFPNVPTPGQLANSAAASSVWEISSRLRAPYLLQSAVAVERQLPANTTISLTYSNSHGLHLLRSEDINAPLPGTFDPLLPASGVFPLGKTGPTFLMESAGLYNQHQAIVNINSRVSRKISLFGSYVFTRAMSNTDGLNTFPATPYSMAGEYGRAATDIRHRVSFGGTINARWSFSLSPLLTLYSGQPFDLSVGHDLYGDTLFNGRPGIAADRGKAGVIQTGYGLLDPNPAAGEPVAPRNFGRGPGIVQFGLRGAKTFAFGRLKEGERAVAGGEGPRQMPSGPFSTGGGGQSSRGASNRRYSLAVSMSVRNILNHDNPGPIVGNIASPRFGRANQPYGAGTLGGTGFSESANNRRLELGVRFNF